MPRRPTGAALLAILALSGPSGRARADAPGPEPTSAVASSTVAAASDDEAALAVARPEDAGGVVIPEKRGFRPLLWIPRGTFLPLRYVIELPAVPVRFLADIYERYQLRERFERIFFNDARTFGVFPTAFVETGFGANIGARVIHKDLFGEKERLRASVGWGGRDDQRAVVLLESGERFGELIEMVIDGGYEAVSDAAFFGIGNGAVGDGPPASRVDPLADPTAFETRFARRLTRGRAAVVAHLGSGVSAELRGSWTGQTFRGRVADGVKEPPIQDVYLESGLVGFSSGLSSLYGELDLTMDTRWQPSRFISRALPSTGIRANGFIGAARGLGEDPSRYTRWGVDAQYYLDLFHGNRVLVLRAYVEGLIGRLEHIPFVDLPTLGGVVILRGFERDRFRDRGLALLSVEYEYPLAEYASGYVFLDAGQVWRDASSIALDRVKIGGGGGIQLHTTSLFLFRLQVAGSREGIFIGLHLDPFFERRPRRVRE